MGAQTAHIAGVKQIDRAAKDGVFDALMVGQVQLIGARGRIDMGLESRPTGETVFAGDGELRIAEFQTGGKYLRIGALEEAGMEFSKALACARITLGVGFEQISPDV